METLLVINAHPTVDSEKSVSLQVLGRFLQEYRKVNPDGPIDRIDLYRDYVPGIDATFLSAWDKRRNGEPQNEDELRISERMSEIMRQFKRANKYVIAMPVHNFNIPSKLKDYMDNIIIPKETYHYTEKGSAGLLTDGRSLLVIQASDAVYTNNDWYTEVEYSHKYLKSIFNFLGVMDYRIIRAQGKYSFGREAQLAKAYQEAEMAAAALAGKPAEAKRTNAPAG
ncbi:FMN-dependent NADH-azoreductase [Paenibacillus hamazuiensis]|uniref:FMN-dependent NADH-azoreductase n=1 Tax=Paenibacillus hamazuiensis TaxID=2936508 RepID=UPI00200BF9FE|nr:NAD(P)H-dependent oxidoreductase [Paenibacillus hamazuiensis]